MHKWNQGNILLIFAQTLLPVIQCSSESLVRALSFYRMLLTMTKFFKSFTTYLCNSQNSSKRLIYAYKGVCYRYGSWEYGGEKSPQVWESENLLMEWIWVLELTDGSTPVSDGSEIRDANLKGRWGYRSQHKERTNCTLHLPVCSRIA